MSKLQAIKYPIISIIAIALALIFRFLSHDHTIWGILGYVETLAFILLWQVAGSRVGMYKYFMEQYRDIANDFVAKVKTILDSASPVAPIQPEINTSSTPTVAMTEVK